MAPSFQRVPESELRERFNRLRYWERAQAGELMALVGEEREVQVDWEPAGTMSQLVTYYEPDLTKVAIVHQYLRPDGTLGASGRPDPKWVFEDGVVYAFERSKPS